jgi:hypothetical protein
VAVLVLVLVVVVVLLVSAVVVFVSVVVVAAVVVVAMCGGGKPRACATCSSEVEYLHVWQYPDGSFVPHEIQFDLLSYWAWRVWWLDCCKAQAAVVAAPQPPIGVLSAVVFAEQTFKHKEHTSSKVAQHRAAHLALCNVALVRCRSRIFVSAPFPNEIIGFVSPALFPAGVSQSSLQS